MLIVEDLKSDTPQQFLLNGQMFDFDHLKLIDNPKWTIIFLEKLFNHTWNNWWNLLEKCDTYFVPLLE